MKNADKYCVTWNSENYARYKHAPVICLHTSIIYIYVILYITRLPLLSHPEVVHGCVL